MVEINCRMPEAPTCTKCMPSGFLETVQKWHSQGKGQVGRFLGEAQLRWVLSSEKHGLESGGGMCFELHFPGRQGSQIGTDPLHHIPFSEGPSLNTSHEILAVLLAPPTRLSLGASSADSSFSPQLLPLPDMHLSCLLSLPHDSQFYAVRDFDCFTLIPQVLKQCQVPALLKRVVWLLLSLV